MLAFVIAGSADRSTHRIVGDKCTAHSHSARHMLKCADINSDCRDSRHFKHSLYMPHGHVTDRSNGYK